MTRNDYWKAYAKRLTKLEKIYAPKVYKALIQQARDFTKGLREGRQYGNQQMWNDDIAKVLRQMHIRAAISEGRMQLIGLRSQYVTQKRLGTNQEWTDQIIELLRYHNARFVVSITETTTDYLIKELEKGIEDGLSLNEIAAKIDKQVEQIYLNRSFAIARTELNRASNLGTQLAAKDYEYETEKTWITAHDHRVRGFRTDFSHIVFDGQKINTFDKFGNPNMFNNGEDISQPGDPNASAGNTINCRCTIALTGKRDANGRLIKKPMKLF